MSVFLTLWTGSEVSSTNWSILAGSSSTWTWLSSELPKLRMRLTVPPKAGLLGSLRTTMEGLGDSEDVASPPLHGPMLFMTSYPSSNGFSSDSDEGWLSPAVFNLSSSGVTTGGGWDWWASTSGAELYVGKNEQIFTLVKKYWICNTHICFKHISSFCDLLWWLFWLCFIVYNFFVDAKIFSSSVFKSKKFSETLKRRLQSSAVMVQLPLCVKYDIVNKERKVYFMLLRASFLGPIFF